MTINADNPVREPAATSAAVETDDTDVTTTEAEETEESEAVEEPEGEPEDGETETTEEDGEGDDGSTVEVEDDTGKKHKIPKALEGHILRQADYTRKTMALAEDRKSLDADKTALSDTIRAADKTLDQRAQVKKIDFDLAEYEKVDWARLADSSDPEDQRLFNKLKFDREQLIGKRNALVGEIQKADREYIAAQQQQIAKDRAATRELNEKNIKGWSVEADAQMVKDAGRYYGFTREQLMPVAANHAMYRTLWDAVQYRKLLEKKPPAKPAPKRADNVEAKPAAKVAGKGASSKPGLHDGLSTAEWMRRANAKQNQSRKRDW